MENKQTRACNNAVLAFRSAKDEGLFYGYSPVAHFGFHWIIGSRKDLMEMGVLEAYDPHELSLSAMIALGRDAERIKQEYQK